MKDLSMMAKPTKEWRPAAAADDTTATAAAATAPTATSTADLSPQSHRSSGSAVTARTKAARAAQAQAVQEVAGVAQRISDLLAPLYSSLRTAMPSYKAPESAAGRCTAEVPGKKPAAAKPAAGKGGDAGAAAASASDPAQSCCACGRCAVAAAAGALSLLTEDPLVVGVGRDFSLHMLAHRLTRIRHRPRLLRPLSPAPEPAAAAPAAKKYEVNKTNVSCVLWRV